MSGKMQTGKNVTADYIIENMKSRGLTVETDLFAHDLKNNCKDDFKKLATYLNGYAESLKSLVNTFTNVMTKNTMLDSLIAAIDEIKVKDENYFEKKNGVTRALLQIYGTEIFRNRVDSDYWAKQVKERVLESEANVIVITDTRFPNEINVFNDVDMDEITVITIRVERKTGIVDQHESEIALDHFKEWFYVIDNDGSLEELKEATGVVVEEIVNPNDDNYVPIDNFLTGHAPFLPL